MPPSEISPVLTEEECTHRSLREVCGLAGRPVNACSLVTVMVKNYARVRVTATPDVPLCLEYGQFKGNAFGCSGALAGVSCSSMKTVRLIVVRFILYKLCTDGWLLGRARAYASDWGKQQCALGVELLRCARHLRASMGCLRACGARKLDFCKKSAGWRQFSN